MTLSSWIGVSLNGWRRRMPTRRVPVRMCPPPCRMVGSGCPCPTPPLFRGRWVTSRGWGAS